MGLRESDLERLDPRIISYDGAPLSEVNRALLRAVGQVNDFGDDGLSASSLGATDGANILAFHHQLARTEYRKVIDEARQELTGFLTSMRGIGQNFEEADSDLAAQMRMLQALVAGAVGTQADRRSPTVEVSQDVATATEARL